MATKTKIKIIDNSTLRAEIDALYEQANQICLSNWAIKCVRHILQFSENSKVNSKVIDNGFTIIELWKTGKARVYEVRQAAFKIHEVARNCESEIEKNAMRTVGHAVAVGHLKQHAMVCSDYAIKTIQLISPENFDKITEERQWQLNELRLLMSK